MISKAKYHKTLTEFIKVHVMKYAIKLQRINRNIAMEL